MKAFECQTITAEDYVFVASGLSLACASPEDEEE